MQTKRSLQWQAFMINCQDNVLRFSRFYKMNHECDLVCLLFYLFLSPLFLKGMLSSLYPGEPVTRTFPLHWFDGFGSLGPVAKP